MTVVTMHLMYHAYSSVSDDSSYSLFLVSPVSVFQAWYRRGMVNASLKNYSSAMHDLEVALSMEVTSSGKSNIQQELKLILLKHQNANEVGRSSGDCKDAGLPHTGWNCG